MQKQGRMQSKGEPELVSVVVDKTPVPSETKYEHLIKKLCKGRKKTYSRSNRKNQTSRSSFRKTFWDHSWPCVAI